MKIDNKNADEANKLNLKILRNKGFHIKFKNGWTVSVQFGVGNYCDNYNNDVEEFKDIGKFPYASNDAEVWSWNDKKNFPSEPLGYQSPEQILKFMNKISKRK